MSSYLKLLGGKKSQIKAFTLSGYIYDADSGEPLIGAEVLDIQKINGTLSNEYGFYSLSFSKNKKEVIVSYLGYKDQKVLIDILKSSQVDIYLKMEINQLTGVEVYGKNKINETTEISKHSLSKVAIEKIPALFGEEDLQQALLSLPGVNTVGDGTTGFNVRGGGTDQNLVLVDEASLYNSAHLFGFISAINSDAIKKVSFYKAGIPAKFGGRASSVVDIRLKEGNKKTFKGALSINPIASKIILEIPILKDRFNIIISGRRSFLDWLLPVLIPKNEKEEHLNIGFYDLNLIGSYQLNKKNKLFLSSYLGKDTIESSFEQDNGQSVASVLNFGWENSLTSLRWNHLFSDQLFSNLTLSEVTIILILNPMWMLLSLVITSLISILKYKAWKVNMIFRSIQNLECQSIVVLE